MAVAIHMPPLSMTGEEIRVMRWKRREGDPVATGDVLLEVETEKATLDVAATGNGTLLKVMAPEGSIVEVGDILCYIGAAGEEIPWLAAGNAAGAALPSPVIPGPEDLAPADPLIA